MKSLLFLFSILLTQNALAVSGKNFLNLMAYTCSDADWKTVSAWAQKRQIANRTNFKAQPDKITENQISFDKGQFVINIVGKNNIEAKFQGQTVKATSACGLVASMIQLKNKKTSQHLLPSLLVSTAQAEEKFIDESQWENYATVAGTAAALLLAYSPPVTVAMLPLLGIASIGAVAYTEENLRDINAKDNFEEILNTKFKIDCSTAMTVVSTSEKKIVVSKSASGNTVDVVSLKSGKTIAEDRNNKQAEKGYAFMSDLAKQCNSAEDAKNILADLDKNKKQAAERLAAMSKTAPAAQPGGSQQGAG